MLNREQLTCEVGEAWADDNEALTALMVESPYAYLLTLTHSDNNINVPKMYNEAMRWPDLWKPIMDEELKVMEDRGVFKLVEASQVLADKNIVGCWWVFANKFNAEGEATRRRACLVVKGFSQVASEDFDEMYVAVMRLESLWMSAAVAAQEGLEIWQVDFVSAYLNSIPKHEVYMKPPPGLLGGEGKLARVQKTIYGLMQGGFDWYWTLDGAYKDMGYRKS